MAYAPIPVLKDVPRYPTRSDGERLDELMQAALNGGSDMVVDLNKNLIPAVNAVIPALNEAMPNLAAIVAAPEKAASAAASATAAAGSASSASGSATTATNAKTAAEAAKTAAQGSATSAAGSAATANTKAGEASASATSASGSAATATTAKNAAELAKTQAEAAKTAAQGSATAAAGSATTANTAKTAAETAKTAAQTAESNALASKNAASASATNAATSETNANASKNAAAGSATAANTAKTAAEAANTAAQTAKTGAENAKTQADAAKTAAAGSATAAKASETESAAILKKVEDAEIGIFPPATSTTAGVVTLSSAIDSPSETEAATPCAVQKAADLAKAAKVSSESWTLTAAVPANGQITLPRGYIVGAKEMMLFKGGLLVNYADIGTPGKWSTVCKLTDGAASGDVMTMVGALETAPSVVLDFEGGAWPKELVCTRATVDYVFDDNGKVQEVPANTPAITKDPVTGRKGLQIFRQRTRLNKYYKYDINLSAAYINRNKGMSSKYIEDDRSPVGGCARITYTHSANIEQSSGPYVDYVIRNDIPNTPSAPRKYSFSICVKADKQMKVRVESYVQMPDATTIRVYSAPDIIDTEYILITGSVTTLDTSYVSILPRIYYQSDKEYEDKTDGYIDIAYIQIEESAVPTPLIAGPEGQQVTVAGAKCTQWFKNRISTLTVIGSKKNIVQRQDGTTQHYLCSIATPEKQGYQLGVINYIQPTPPDKQAAVAYTKNKLGTWANYGHLHNGQPMQDVSVGIAITDATKFKLALNGVASSSQTTIPNGFTTNSFVYVDVFDNVNTSCLYRIDVYPYDLKEKKMSDITVIEDLPL